MARASGIVPRDSRIAAAALVAACAFCGAAFAQGPARRASPAAPVPVSAPPASPPAPVPVPTAPPGGEATRAPVLTVESGEPAPAPAASTASAQGRTGLRIVVLDVGQGDAQLIVGPAKTMLVDFGDAPGARRSGTAHRLAPRLETLAGGRRLDYVLVTHFHADHVGAHGSGVFALIDREGFTVDTVVDRGDRSFATPDTGPHRDWTLAVPRWIDAGKVVRRHVARVGDRFDLGGGAAAEVVAAGGVPAWERRAARDPGAVAACPPSENDYSVALKITLGDFEYFTGGDLSGSEARRSYGGRCESYADLETPIAAQVGNVEVMRASHHGSHFSTADGFVRTLASEVSILSTGGRYGHPATDTVARLTGRSVVYSTGRFAPGAWPDGPPAAVRVVGDVVVEVAADGRTYAVAGARFRSFSDAEEASGQDRLSRPSLPTPSP